MEPEIKVIKEEHNFTSDEKLKFCGYGEWVEESDSLHFEYLGYEAIIYRIFKKEIFCPQEAYFGGHLCGYVKIPEDHPYFRKEDIDIDCHGGITFNEVHEEHFIGFDCGHSMDYVPTMALMRKTRPELIELDKMMPEELRYHPIFNPIYRNMKYCIKECISIITKLNDISKEVLRKSKEDLNAKTPN